MKVTERSLRIQGVAKETLESYGIQTMVGNEYRSTYDIIKDLAKVYNELSDQQERHDILEKTAGKNRANALAALILNIEQVDKATQVAQNSAGSATREIEIMSQSLSYKLNALKENLQGTFTSAVNTDLFKGIIDGANKAVDAVQSFSSKFGGVNTLLVGITTVVGLTSNKFKNFASNLGNCIPAVNNLTVKLQQKTSILRNSIQTQQEEIQKMVQAKIAAEQAGQGSASYASQLLNLNGKLALTQIKLIATEAAATALNAALSMGLSLGISAAITGLNSLFDSLVTTDEELKQLNSDFNNNQDVQNTLKTDTLIEKYKTLTEEIKTAKETNQDYSEKVKELNDVVNVLKETYPDLTTKINENTGAYELNIEQVEKLTEAERENVKAKANDVLNENRINEKKDVENLIETYNECTRVIKIFNEAKAQGSKTATFTDEKGYEHTWDISRVKEYIEWQDKLKDTLQTSANALKFVEEDNTKLAGSYDLIKQALGLTTPEFEKLSNSAKDADGVLQEVINSEEEGTDTTDKFKDSIKDLQDSFSGFSNSIDLLKTAIQEMQDYGDLTNKTMEKILDSGDARMMSLLNYADPTTFIQQASQALSDFEAKRDEAKVALINAATEQEGALNRVKGAADGATGAMENLANITNRVREEVQNGGEIEPINMVIDTSNLDGMVQHFKDAFGEILVGENDLTNLMTQAVADYVNAGNELYTQDANNLQAQLDAKANASAMWENEEIIRLAGIVNANAGNYDVDMQNWANLVNNKSTNGQIFSDNVLQQVAQMIILNSQNYSEDTLAWANAINNKSQNNTDMVNTIMQNIAEMILNNADNYSIDTVNWATAINNKDENNSVLCSNVTGVMADAINNMADQYKQDVENFRNATNAKIAMYNKLADKVDKAQKKISTGDESELLNMQNRAHRAANEMYDSMEKLQRVEEVYRDAVKVTGATFGGSNAQGISVGGNVVKGNADATIAAQKEAEKNAKAAEKSARQAQKEAEQAQKEAEKAQKEAEKARQEEIKKHIEAIKKLENRYVNVTKLIKDYQHQLEINQLDIDATNDNYWDQKHLIEQRIKLIEKEIKHARDLSIMRQQERDMLVEQIRAKGGIIADNQEVTNYADFANVADEGERQINQALLDRYYSLVTDLIPKAEAEWRGYFNDIYALQRKQNQQYANLLEERRDKFIKNLEKQRDDIKKDLELRKKMMQRSWDEEDRQDERADKQSELANLQSQLADAERSGNVALQEQIRKQIADAQKELNKMIRDSEREAISTRIDDEIQINEDEFNSRIDAIKEKLSDEEILAMVNMGVKDIDGLLNSIKGSTKNINNTFIAVGDTINNSWNSSLDETLSKIEKIQSAFKNINMNNGINMGSINSKQNAGNTINQDINIPININGATNPEETAYMVKKEITKALKKYDDDQKW